MKNHTTEGKCVIKKTKIAMLGSGFIAEIHLECYQRFVPEAEVVAVYSRNIKNAEAFAKKYNIDHSYDDFDKMLDEVECEIVDVCLPNYLHHEVVLKAANAGKHLIVEKPLCLTLEEADEMIETCKRNNRKLMYAEELCFAPKYERVRAIVENGAVGDVYMLKQCEKHSGPHSRWFYESDKSGGGVIMDMGCHAMAWFAWMLKSKGGKPKNVYADFSRFMHDTDAEDHALTLVEFETDHGKVICLAEDSWVKHGGMEDKVEVYGTEGVAYADLFQGNSSLVYSMEGYDYASEKAGDTTGWTFPIFEEAFNQGYPHELKHFVDCVRNDKEPLVTGEDGRAVLELIYAAYESARTGKKVDLPFYAKVSKPNDLLDL
jgi:myo-inositol 2-dehydrogenase/D-chiro-inositol 1-dehydrogenase